MGRIVVHLHGAAKNPSHRASISDYSTRLRAGGVRLIEHSDRTTVQGYLEEVSRAANSRSVVLLQESGEMHDSESFASMVGRWRLESDETHLVVGPADGFGDLTGSDDHAARTRCGCAAGATLSGYHDT